MQQISLRTKNEPHSSSSPFQNVVHEITADNSRAFASSDTFRDQLVTFASWHQDEDNT